MSVEHRGWYDRNYLPHFDTNEHPQMITFRLADSLPQDVVEQLLSETEPDDDERHARFQTLLDNGYGSCVLERDDCAKIVADALNYHDGSKYRLVDWVVMPNHVHVAFDRAQDTLERIVHSWKSFTSNQIKKLLGTYDDGEPLWQKGFHDRFVRDEHHLVNVQGYIYFNPVQARLVEGPFQWTFSSVHDHEQRREFIERWWEGWKDQFWQADLRG